MHLGKHGPYVRIDGKANSVPGADVLYPADLDETLLARLKAGDSPIGVCPSSGLPIYKKNGRRGPYVARGTRDEAGYKTGPLLPGVAFEELTCDVALRLLEIPLGLGTHPETGLEVVLKTGPHGPYVVCGTETRSVANDITALDTTLEHAVALLAQPKQFRGRRGMPTVLKVLGVPRQSQESRSSLRKANAGHSSGTVRQTPILRKKTIERPSRFRGLWS